MSDELFMDMAIEEARSTIGRTSPNPPVGAILVKEGKILSRGKTAPAGGPHAEVVAMSRAKIPLDGAAIYTTLEPCCHYGRTGPCAAAIVDAGISRVIVGCHDKNPRVNGKGIEYLLNAGLEVDVGIRGGECEKIALPFFTWAQKNRPYIVLKAAVSLDGRIALESGDSKWISSEESRRRVHGWRDKFDAILVGAETVIKDNPLLSTRLPEGGGRDPVRVILDGELAAPLNSKLYSGHSSSPSWVVASRGLDPLKEKEFYKRHKDNQNVELILLDGKSGRVNIYDLLHELADRDIVSLLVEGGSVVHGEFIKSGFVDEIRLFIAPKFFGKGPAWLNILSEDIPLKVSETTGAKIISVEMSGKDILLKARPVFSEIE